MSMEDVECQNGMEGMGSGNTSIKFLRMWCHTRGAVTALEPGLSNLCNYMYHGKTTTDLSATPFPLGQAAELAPIGWNSQFIRPSRLMEIKQAVIVELTTSDWSVDCFTSAEWKFASDIVNALKPFYDATVEVGAGKCHFSHFFLSDFHCVWSHGVPCTS